MAAAPIIRSDRVLLGERAVAFKLFRVPRRRNVHVLVNDEGDLEVRAPWRFSLDDARAAIHEHRNWVLGALEQTRSRLRLRPQLVSGSTLPLLDERLRLRVQVQAQLSLFDVREKPVSRLGVVRRDGRELHVQMHAAGQSAVRRLLETWYREQAEEAFAQHMPPIAQQLGVQYSQVTVRAQRTRWGSCSSRGTINLNWRLMLMPSRLMDYVLAHELAHLREMNHSPAFWALVGSIFTDYRERRRDLEIAARQLPL
ncbi:MAG: putative metal-dependent hydrolase [Gammaproteobacteria bacterium]